MPRCFPGLLASACLAMWLSGVLPKSANAQTFDFLYIEANEGNASGGHAAIKLGDRVFHFQHVEPGFLRLYRSDYSAFRFAYGDQQNRKIRGHRITISEDFFQALLDTFQRRWAEENRQFGRLQDLQEDYDLSAAVFAHPPPESSLKALGYFLEDYAVDEYVTIEHRNSQNPLLRDLGQTVAASQGPNFMRDKRQALRIELDALTPTASAQNAEFDDLTFARRYRNCLLNLAALDVLQAAQPPRPSALLTMIAGSNKLEPLQLRALSEFKDRLRDDVLRLLISERPDWGYPLLVGMARLHAVEQSLASGYLAVLDRRQADPDPVVAEADLPAALQYTQRLLATARARLSESAALDERSYAQLEFSANAWFALETANAEGDFAGLPALDPTPAKPGRAKWVRKPLPAPALVAYRHLAQNKLEQHQHRLAEHYAYDLLDSNCVTEIFKLINTTLVGPTSTNKNDEAGLRQASERELGGYLDGGGPNMIPFVAFERVGERYRVTSSYELPAYRERRIAGLYRSSPDWWVNVLESNTFSSSIYRRNGGDSAFVFFTQDAVLPRPLQGGLNLAAAALETAFGLLSWPWDGGSRVHKGVKGWAVSTAELLFFNIRKGSFPGLLPDWSAERRSVLEVP